MHHYYDRTSLSSIFISIRTISAKPPDTSSSAHH